MQRKHTGLKIFLGLTLLIAVGVVWTHSATLYVNVTPANSTVVIGDKSYAPGQAIKAPPQNFKITVKSSGYPSQTTSTNVGFRQSKAITVDLTRGGFISNTIKNGEETMVLNDQQSNARTSYDKSIDQAGTDLELKYPFIKELPYRGSDFQIEYGKSMKPGATKNDVAFYVTAPNDAAKKAAADWFKERHFDISSLEIVYQ